MKAHPTRLRRVKGEFSRAFRSLRRRNYRLYWFGQMFSMVGTWAGEIALAWLVLSITDSPAMLGLAVTVRFLPAIVLSPFGGILADRFAKRPMLLMTQSGQFLIALALAVFTTVGAIGIPLILALAILRGVGDALDTPARQAFVMEMVGTEDVANAVALNSLQFNVARIVGPVIGALLIGAIGIAASFYFNAASFLVMIGSLMALRTSELRLDHHPSKAPMLRQLREVLAFSYRTPDIMVIFLLVFAIATFGYQFMTVLPLLAKYVLDSGSAGLGALTSSLGVGSMLAAMWMAYRGTPTHRLMLISAVCFTLLLLLLGLFRQQAVTMVLLVGLGLCGILFVTSANTRLLLLAPNNLRGRVMGVYTWLFMGTAPLGSLLPRDRRLGRRVLRVPAFGRAWPAEGVRHRQLRGGRRRQLTDVRRCGKIPSDECLSTGVFVCLSNSHSPRKEGTCRLSKA